MDITATLKEVKDLLRKNFRSGCTCPACGQHVQMYSRSLTSSMAYGLILLSQAPREYIHIEEFLKGKDIPSSIRGDFPKLRYWGLIQPSEDQEGFYKITDEGVAFVHGLFKVKSNVLIYNNKFYGMDGNHVDIRHCLKKKFNYEQLMQGKL